MRKRRAIAWRAPHYVRKRDQARLPVYLEQQRSSWPRAPPSGTADRPTRTRPRAGRAAACVTSQYSSVDFARSRPIAEGDHGAPSPDNPRSASSNSPRASPCRYSRRGATSSVRRTNNGRIRLSKGPSRPRTRSRRTVIRRATAPSSPSRGDRAGFRPVIPASYYSCVTTRS